MKRLCLYPASGYELFGECLLDVSDVSSHHCKQGCFHEHDQDFPSGAVDKNLLVNAGDTGLIPDLERFHRPRSTKALGPASLEPVRNERSQLSKKPSRHNEEQPPRRN